MISILILTKNEEQDLPTCLESVKWSNDIHVLDSYSTDRSREICQEFGVIFSERKFDNYANQRNFGLQLPFKNDWVFILDADERVPESLEQELKVLIPTLSEEISGIRIRRRDHLHDRWLKHSQMTPFYIRVVRKGKAKYHREINEVIEVEGEVMEARTFFNHYPFSKGYQHWLEKHNKYSTMEAQRWVDENKGSFNFSLKKALFSTDFSEKRYHQKGLFYKVPLRPLIKWCYLVFFKQGILDGKAGIINANLQAIYEYFIVIKTKELLKK
jgi:glycosyltransferase involved in cell wall biosynthesis